MPHLHEEEFQILQDMNLQGGRKFNLATCHVISSSEPRAMCGRTCRPWAGGARVEGEGRSSPTPADVKMRIPGFGHALTLAPSLVPQLPGPTLAEETVLWSGL